MGCAETYAALVRRLHQGLREAIDGLDEAALNWIPGPETNSMAVLVVHVLGNESEVLKVVAGLPTARDRDAEFLVRRRAAADLLRLLDAADVALDEHAAAITTADLDALRVRPGHAEDTAQPGRYLLFNSYGHAREHLGQLLLTKQLYSMERPKA